MYDVHRACRPYRLVVLIAAQKAQSVQCYVTVMQTNLDTIIPAAENVHSASTDVGVIDCRYEYTGCKMWQRTLLRPRTAILLLCQLAWTCHSCSYAAAVSETI